jgi:hypothetical protein
MSSKDDCVACGEAAGCYSLFQTCAGFPLYPPSPQSEDGGEVGNGHVEGPESNSTAKVHRGILQRWSKVKESVRMKMREMSNAMSGQLLRLYVAGHGLGGAFALMSALDISLMELPKNVTVDISVYAFGTPLFSNKEFSRAIEDKLSHHAVFQSKHDSEQVDRLAKILKDYYPMKNTIQLEFNDTYLDPSEGGERVAIDKPDTYSTLLRLKSTQLTPNELLPFMFETGEHHPQGQISLLCASLLQV